MSDTVVGKAMMILRATGLTETLEGDLVTESGRRVAVVSHRNGRRDLVLFDPDDPDACQADIPLTDDEAEAPAGILARPHLPLRGR